MSWKVVIVEDEDLLRNGLIQAISWEKLGFTVIGDADNGKVGLEMILRLKPDVVFSDIRMAQVDGLTMAEQVRKQEPEIQFVFISGYDEFDYVRRAMAMGAARYILKPIRLAEVEETLRDLAQKLEKERRIREKEDAWKLQPDTENGSGESLNFMNYDKRPLLQAVESGEQELICEECTKLEQALNDQRVVSHMHLILIVTSIFEELVRLMQKADQVIPQLEGDPMEYYSRIVSDDGTRAEILKNLQEFCCVVGDLFAKAHETRQQASLKRAIRYMEQEYRNEELLMGDVAKHSFVSSSYLSTMLKKETGKTFSEYLTDIRMEHAKKLLRETEMKSYEVAQACGFANATYFSTVFKRMNGMSPSAWKKARE